MAFTHTITRAWHDAAGRSLTGSSPTLSADGEVDLEVAVPINADTPIDAYIRQAGLKTIFVLSTVDLTLTFKTAVPATTGIIALKAGVPYDWILGDDATQNPIPIAADVQTIHVNSAAVGTLKVRALYDSTP